MKTRRKKLVKNVFIFIAMFMIVGMYIVPVTSNAGQVAKGWGFAFNYDGQERYTNPEAKNTTSSVRMYCEYSDCYNSYYYAKVYSEKRWKYKRCVTWLTVFIFRGGNKRHVKLGCGKWL